MDRAYVFPGQGSQSPEMAKKLYESSALARERLEIAEEEVPGLLEACTEPGGELLEQTEIVQPAIFAVSAILWDLLPAELRSASYLAGHSLGEYSALYAAGVMDYRMALRLVKARAQVMGSVASAVGGGMLAVIGPEYANLVGLIKELGLEQELFPANQNSPGQTVLSGTQEALEKAAAFLKEQPEVKKVVPLAVSGPFHSPLISQVTQEFGPILDKMDFSEPRLPVVSPTAVCLVERIDQIKEMLLAQFTSPVLWTETVLWLHEHGVRTIIEVGPGKVLTGLVRRIESDFARINVSNEQEALALNQKLG